MFTGLASVASAAVLVHVVRADQNTVSMLVVFESEEKARARESDPRRDKALAAARTTVAEIFDGAPTFTDLVVVAEYTP